MKKIIFLVSLGFSYQMFAVGPICPDQFTFPSATFNSAVQISPTRFSDEVNGLVIRHSGIQGTQAFGQPLKVGFSRAGRWCLIKLELLPVTQRDSNSNECLPANITHEQSIRSADGRSVVGILVIQNSKVYLFSVDQSGQKDLNAPYYLVDAPEGQPLRATAYIRGKSAGVIEMNRQGDCYDVNSGRMRAGLRDITCAPSNLVRQGSFSIEESSYYLSSEPHDRRSPNGCLTFNTGELPLGERIQNFFGRTRTGIR